MLERVRIHSIDGGAISGSGEVLLTNVTVGVLNTGAVNIANMTAFQMDHCKLAQVDQLAIRYQR